MAGFISDFFGFRAADSSDVAAGYAARMDCPVLGSVCTKTLGRDRSPAGACAVRQVSANAPDVICCPIRLYADDYKLLRIISKRAFGAELGLYSGRIAIDRAVSESGAVAVFGHGWGGELQLPQRDGTGAYSVDWVLARLDGQGKLVELSAIEVQTIDTTGNLPEFPSGQPGTVHFFSYDYDEDGIVALGKMMPLAFQEEYCTAIHKVQEAFSNIALPESNVYRTAVQKALFGSVRYEFISG
jgi:hypothetical protein